MTRVPKRTEDRRQNTFNARTANVIDRAPLVLFNTAETLYHDGLANSYTFINETFDSNILAKEGDGLEFYLAGEFANTAANKGIIINIEDELGVGTQISTGLTAFGGAARYFTMWGRTNLSASVAWQRNILVNSWSLIVDPGVTVRTGGGSGAFTGTPKKINIEVQGYVQAGFAANDISLRMCHFSRFKGANI